jgi:hypothetical protein
MHHKHGLREILIIQHRINNNIKINVKQMQAGNSGSPIECTKKPRLMNQPGNIIFPPSYHLHGHTTFCHISYSLPCPCQSFVGVDAPVESKTKYEVKEHDFYHRQNNPVMNSLPTKLLEFTWLRQKNQYKERKKKKKLIVKANEINNNMNNEINNY